MTLLSFTVRNHRGIRGETTLKLVRPTLRTLQPTGASWASVTYPVAGVFGGNATGKTSLLSALKYAMGAVRDPYGTHGGQARICRESFKCADQQTDPASSYAMEFVHDGRRHEYGFELDDTQITREWLRDVPTRRWRTILDRHGQGKSVRLKGSLRRVGTMGECELALTRAFAMSHPELGPVFESLVSGFDALMFSGARCAAQLRRVSASLLSGTVSAEDMRQLLSAAGLGIDTVHVASSDVFSGLRGDTRALLAKMVAGGGQSAAEKALSANLGDHEARLVWKQIRFSQQADGGPILSGEDLSDGTVAWLAVAIPALVALRQGSLLVVDDINTNLHPYLLDLLLQAFNEPNTNIHHAQLIFSSHETYALSPLSRTTLDPEQVWFTDRSNDGATTLTSHASFSKHPDANVQKRYLSGRYGGVASTTPSAIERLVSMK